MSDRPSLNPGNGGNDDVYRWSGDQRQLPNGQNNNGDRYIYDGSQRNQQGGDDQYDAFHRDRMPGTKPSDYNQAYSTREVRDDGTVIINNFFVKRAYVDQRSVQGADYRSDPRVDFRHCDPNLQRLRENNGSSSYYEQGQSRYNGSFRERPNQDFRNDDMQWRIEQARQQQFDQQMADQRRIEIARQMENQRNFEQQRRIDDMRDYQMRRDADEALRIQMYNENCRQYNNRHERYQPYYSGGNGGCFGNGGYRPPYNDGYDSGYGGPCFGNRSGISIRIPIGHGGGSFRIGF